jgi:hypothetical protein
MGESLNNADKNSVRLFKQIKTFFGQHKYIPALAVIYILFHAFFENLFRVAVVKPFLSYCTSSVLNDVIFIAIFLGIVIFCIYRISKRYYVSDKRIFISIILFFFLGYYRLISDVWGFESFTFCDGLKYIDVIFTFLIGDLLVKISFYLFKEKEADDKENKGFCLDSPLSESGKDQLNRENLVKQVCERLENTANKDASFAIGVTSEWGNGKTSFLNLIKRNLDKNQRVIIDYNPWLNSDGKSATLSFFDEMSSALKAYDSSLSNDILKYAKMLIDSSGGKYSNLLNACLSLDATPTLRERFEQINDAIKRTKLQIIVFIDDLDRLYDSEILEVLSLIRNSANFSNTIFIVAYDRNYLIAALKKVNNYHPHAYLEKIFQLELPLPQFERDIIAKILKDKLLPYLSDEDKNELESIVSDSIQNYNHQKSVGLVNTEVFRDFILDGIKTIRDINRFVNSFLVSYNSLKGEIVLSDLLNVELLKIKYPGIYALLANNKGKYLNPFRGSLVLVKNEANSSKTEFELYLKDYFSEAGLVQTKIQDAMLYVFSIFREHIDKPIKPESICHPIGIDRYFHYQLLNSDMSVTEFAKYRMKSDKEFQAQIEIWFDEGKNGLHDLLYKIDLYNGVEDYVKIIRAIFFYGSLLIDRKKSFSKDDGGILLNMLSEPTYSKYYKPNDFVQFLTTLFNEQKFPYLFASFFINYTLNYISKNKMSDDFTFVLQEDVLLEQNIQYLKRYCDECTKVDKKLFWLYNNCYYERWKSMGANAKLQLLRPIEEADKLFVACAEKDPANFMKIIFVMDNNDPTSKKKYNISSSVKRGFGGWDEFEAYLGSLDESKVKDIQLFTDFFVKLKNNEYSYIEFDFGKSVPYELIGVE